LGKEANKDMKAASVFRYLFLVRTVIPQIRPYDKAIGRFNQDNEQSSKAIEEADKECVNCLIYLHVKMLSKIFQNSCNIQHMFYDYISESLKTWVRRIIWMTSRL